MDFDSLDDLDATIIEVRAEKSSLESQAKLETKLSIYLKDLDKKKGILDDKKINFKSSELDAQKQIKERVREFSDYYNSLMMHALSDVRKAEIDSDSYLPLLNGGLYREASAGVSVRFLYYLTFLKLSLEKTIPYPNFLLVDTPETAGIDEDNLNSVMQSVEDIRVKHRGAFQVIIASGEKKYPESMKGFVVESLTKKNRLLKPIQKLD